MTHLCGFVEHVKRCGLQRACQVLRVGRVDGRRASLLDLQEKQRWRWGGREEQEEQRLILQNRQHAEEVLLDALSGIQRVTRLDRLPFQSFETVYFTRYENDSRSHPATEWKTLSPCNSLRCCHGSVSDISGFFMHGTQKCFVSKPADNFNLKTFETPSLKQKQLSKIPCDFLPKHTSLKWAPTAAGHYVTMLCSTGRPH